MESLGIQLPRYVEIIGQGTKLPNRDSQVAYRLTSDSTAPKMR
ncbi:MAG: hypothetical protein ACYCUY_11210 [Acidithiobacillus sp.]